MCNFLLIINCTQGRILYSLLPKRERWL